VAGVISNNIASRTMAINGRRNQADNSVAYQSSYRGASAAMAILAAAAAPSIVTTAAKCEEGAAWRCHHQPKL